MSCGCADALNARLMTDLYAGLLGETQRVDVALTNAMRRMLASRQTRDPGIWAAYSVYVVEN